MDTVTCVIKWTSMLQQHLLLMMYNEDHLFCLGLLLFRVQRIKALHNFDLCKCKQCFSFYYPHPLPVPSSLLRSLNGSYYTSINMSWQCEILQDLFLHDVSQKLQLLNMSFLFPRYLYLYRCAHDPSTVFSASFCITIWKIPNVPIVF